ncbi:DUF4920 domain-containing protein [Vicingaceae bacterium]|nr:DUF4920 domain-containing protein [Vicingaceae bacterium]
MKKSVLFFAVGAMLFATACDTKKVEAEEVVEETTENTEEAMEAAAEESNQFANNPEGHFGKIIEAEGAKFVDEFTTLMDGKDSLNVKIQAVAADVCQNKGCWMKVETADGNTMRIKFKDYGFFVPMDITGKNVIFEGVAYRDTTSVEDLKHYAMDGGQSEEEINAIMEPKISTSFLAEGVIVLD